MNPRLSSSIRKLVHSYTGMKTSEKYLVGAVVVFLVFFLLQQAAGLVGESLEGSRELVAQRKTQMQEIGIVLKRYANLRQRKVALQETYDRSQMTFEQLSSELDKVVRDAIGSDNYELKKPHPPVAFGFEYEKQEFSLIVKTLTLDQLVKLLYQIEHGERPIFLSKVDINKALSGTDFSAVLEIYSISKATTA